MSHWQVFLSAVRLSLVHFIAQTPPRLYLSLVVPRVFFQTAFFLLVAAMAQGPELVRFVLIGNAFQIAAMYVFNGVSYAIKQERVSGTLEVILVTPAPHLFAMLGRCAAAFVEGLGQSFLVLFVAGPIVGLGGTEMMRMAAMAPFAVVMVLSLVGVGFLLGAVGLTSQIGNFIPNLAAGMLMVFSGVNYPTSVLPGWAQAISAFLPLTNGLQGLRMVVLEGRWGQAAGLMATEAFVAVAYLTLGLVVFRWRLQATRRGTADFI